MNDQPYTIYDEPFIIGKLNWFYQGVFHLPDNYLDGFDEVDAKEKYALVITYKGKKKKFALEEFLALFEQEQP